MVGATVSSLSQARIAALRDNLPDRDRASVDRYLNAQERIRTRWIVLRVTGISATAALLGFLLSDHYPLGWFYGWVAAVLSYAIPSELTRQYTSHRAERLLPTILQLAQVGEWVISPVADPLWWLGSKLSGEPPMREPSATLTETEVEHLVNEGELNGSLAHDQSEMIRNVLDFGEVTAEELMVPRIQVDGLDATLSMDEVLTEVSRTQHSRYPVYKDSVDNVAGVLHVKDLFQRLANGKIEETNVLDLARKPVAFVPEGQLVSTVLKDMRIGRHHMAVVLDEFGGVAGILTLEDLLEEIVGDIQDEHDADEASRIRMVSEHTALVDASTPVADINRTIGTDLPEGEDYVSLGGLLLEQIGVVPPKGSSHEIFGLKVIIREGDARHIAQVELSGVPGAPRSPTTRPPASADS